MRHRRPDDRSNASSYYNDGSKRVRRRPILPIDYRRALLAVGFVVVGGMVWIWLRPHARPSTRIDTPSTISTDTPPAEEEPHVVPNFEDNPELEQAWNYLQRFQSFQRSLTFFHIPKTAGTAVEYAARNHQQHQQQQQQQLQWGSCRFAHVPRKDICQYPKGYNWPATIGWWHIPRQFFPLQKMDPYHGQELFAVVRNSYDRMVSEFYYICSLKVLDWRPNQCHRDKLFVPDYMNQWLQTKLKAVEAGTALGYLTDNGHFTPQYEFVFGPHQVRMMDYVLRLEDLDAQFATLMNAFGYHDLVLEKRNALGAQQRQAGYLQVADLNAVTRKVIDERYRYDWEELGYDRKAME